MREGHGVGLVAHAQALPTVLPGVLERVANDALHALSGVDVLLNGNFVGGVLLEDPANTDIQAFGVLPENDQDTDRKSTRLNSSHPSISYAVFCLKKKKKNNNKYDDE